MKFLKTVAFVCLLYLLSLNSISHAVHPLLTFDELHQALSLDKDNHKVIVKSDLYPLNEKSIERICKNLVEHSEIELLELLRVDQRLSKENKIFFRQADLKDKAEVLGLDWSHVKDWSRDAGQYNLLFGEVEAKRDQIDNEFYSILAKNIQSNYDAHPLGFLGECLGDSFSGSVCSLSRLHYPHYRRAFEDRIVQSIVNQAKVKSGRLNLAELGSGDLFQTLVILEKILSHLKAEISYVELHLIDPLYKWEIGKLQQSLAEAKKESIQEEYNITVGNMRRMRFYQFLNWIRVVHPNVEFHLYIHETLSEYIALNSGKKLDGLWAADLDLGHFRLEEEGMATLAMADFDTLLDEGASAFSLMSPDQSIIMVLPKDSSVQDGKEIELSLEEIAGIRFEASEISKKFKGRTSRKVIRIDPPKVTRPSRYCNML